MTPQPAILYILNGRWPTVRAYGLQVAKTCEALAAEGVSVTLVVPRRHSYPEQKGIDPSEIYGIRPAFKIVYLASPDWPVTGTFRRVLFILQQLAFAARAAWFARGRQGIIYSRDAFTLAVAAFMVPRRSLYWEMHKWPKRLTVFHRYLFGRLDGTIAITHGLAHLSRENGVEPRRIAVIPDAVDITEFDIPQGVLAARQAVGISGGPWVGYVGHLSTYGEAKGVDMLIQSMSHVCKEVPGASLVIVGGTRQEIEAHAILAEKAGIRDRVLFAGTVAHSRVPLWLRACDVLVIPYPRTRHYALYMSPLKLFEYMASGKPIVTTDLPSVREIVDESCATFVPAGDNPALSKELTSLLCDESRKASLAAVARKRVEAHTWFARARRIKDFTGIV